jgi:hypothetical protein
VCCPSPEPETHWRTAPVQPPLCIGRYEGTDRFLGRRDHPERSLHSLSQRRENLNKCLVQPCWGTRIRKRRRNTLPGMDCARPKAQRKKSQKSASRGSLSLDNRGPSMWPHLSSLFLAFRTSCGAGPWGLPGLRSTTCAGGFLSPGGSLAPHDLLSVLPALGQAPHPACALGACAAQGGPPLLLLGAPGAPVPHHALPPPPSDLRPSPTDLRTL